MGKYSVPPRNRTGTRTGFTTGTNAAAAAKAATVALLTGQWPETITVTLPDGDTTVMQPAETRMGDGYAYCCMVKDAGDDPDVTHGTLICALVSQQDGSGIALAGGLGVGRVTLPGLGLPVDGPAINPVPRQQITSNVTEAVCQHHPDGGDYLEQSSLMVTISVPDGEQLAQKTLNPRLGIIGGISILGTTGRVYPYSTAAWRASVIQAVEVAATNNTNQVIMATGGRSERFAMAIYPHLPPVAFVECSVFTGAALTTCVDHGVQSAAFVGMIGKMTKTAQGHMQTHVAGNQVDFTFLADVCDTVGAPDALTSAVREANTARHFLELCQEHAFMAPVQHLTELALASCLAFIAEQNGALTLDVVLVDFEGAVLARATGQTTNPVRKHELPKPLAQRLADDPNSVAEDMP